MKLDELGDVQGESQEDLEKFYSDESNAMDEEMRDPSHPFETEAGFTPVYNNNSSRAGNSAARRLNNIGTKLGSCLSRFFCCKQKPKEIAYQPIRPEIF